MINKFKSITLLALLFSIFMVSCDTAEDNVSVVENYTDGAINELHERSGCGFGGCFELVFPVTIVFADETTATVDSLGAMKAAIKAWKEANLDMKERPTFQFPIDVIKDDGTIVTVADESELRALRKECPRNFGPSHGHGKHCFKLEFPFRILLANGTIKVINSREDLPRPTVLGDRAELIFPVNVTLKDGTSKTLNSKVEMIALKQSCR